RSFINVVEADKLPAAFGQFKDKAYRCVFLVLWSFLERAINIILPVGLFMRFSLSKTLRCIGFAFENFVITAQEVFLVLYGFHLIRHRQREFRHFRDGRLIAGGNRSFKFLPECRKISVSCTTFSLCRK